MAEIPKSVDVEIDFCVSDKTAEGFCRLLTDYLNIHKDKDIEVFENEYSHLDGTHFIQREVRITERG